MSFIKFSKSFIGKVKKRRRKSLCQPDREIQNFLFVLLCACFFSFLFSVSVSFIQLLTAYIKHLYDADSYLQLVLFSY